MNDEENILLNAKNGDKDALEKLIKQNERLIWSIVKKFLIYDRSDTDDLFQIGCLGFIKAIKRFNVNLGYKLSTFAVPYIAGEIKRFFRDDGIIKVSRNFKMKKKIKIESINEEMFEDGKIRKQDLIGDKEDEQTKIINKITVTSMIEKLKSRDKKIIKLRYYGEKTQMQVGKILGISQVQVSRIEKKILDDMKEKINC